MACGSDGYVGLVRLEDGRLEIAAALDRYAMQHFGGPGSIAQQLIASAGWPQLAGLERLPWRGTPALTRRPSRVASERLFVVGDSAGYVEPFTGEGMAWALEGAEVLVPLAAEGARAWTPRLAARWTSLLHRTIGERRACRTAAQVLRSQLLTHGMIGMLQRFPTLASPVLHRVHRHSERKAAHS